MATTKNREGANLQVKGVREPFLGVCMSLAIESMLASGASKRQFLCRQQGKPCFLFSVLWFVLVPGPY